MILLLDQGLPRSTVDFLAVLGIEAVHVSTVGMHIAHDAEILERARSENWTVVTLDADFHSLLVLSGDHLPSVIRIRIEGLKGQQLSLLLQRVLSTCSEELARGCLVSVQHNNIRVKRLREE